MTTAITPVHSRIVHSPLDGGQLAFELQAHYLGIFRAYEPRTLDQASQMTRLYTRRHHPLVAPLTRFLVGALDEQDSVIGSAVVVKNHLSGFSEVSMIAVDEVSREQGIGSAILAACETHAAQHNSRSVVVSAERGYIEFYRRRGYRPAHGKVFGRMRGIPMSKKLPKSS